MTTLLNLLFSIGIINIKFNVTSASIDIPQPQENSWLALDRSNEVIYNLLLIGTLRSHHCHSKALFCPPE